jgi:hypothetical protein
MAVPNSLKFILLLERERLHNQIRNAIENSISVVVIFICAKSKTNDRGIEKIENNKKEYKGLLLKYVNSSSIAI